jgi:hypothetical protein
MTSRRIDNFHGNVPNWLKFAELNIDYYTQFIRSWITFNAWFYVTYKNLNQDREIINVLKSTSNPISDKISALLRNDTTESLNFKNSLSQLHNELERNPLPSEKTRLTFTNIVADRNKTTELAKSYRHYEIVIKYNAKAQKGANRTHIQVIQKKTYKTIMDWGQPFWDYNDLNSYLMKFKSSMLHGLKNKIKDHYKNINPLKPINIVRPPAIKNRVKVKPSKCLIINEKENLYFTNQIDLITKSIIEALYRLRCILMHGEINPTKENQKVYKHAFEVLSQVLIVLN